MFLHNDHLRWWQRPSAFTNIPDWVVQEPHPSDDEWKEMTLDRSRLHPSLLCGDPSVPNLSMARRPDPADMGWDSMLKSPLCRGLRKHNFRTLLLQPMDCIPEWQYRWNRAANWFRASDWFNTPDWCLDHDQPICQDDSWYDEEDYVDEPPLAENQQHAARAELPQQQQSPVLIWDYYEAAVSEQGAYITEDSHSDSDDDKMGTLLARCLDGNRAASAMWDGEPVSDDACDRGGGVAGSESNDLDDYCMRLRRGDAPVEAWLGGYAEPWQPASEDAEVERAEEEHPEEERPEEEHPEEERGAWQSGSEDADDESEQTTSSGDSEETPPRRCREHIMFGRLGCLCLRIQIDIWNGVLWAARKEVVMGYSQVLQDTEKKLHDQGGNDG